MQLSLPPDKLARTIATVQSWSRRKVASKRQLQSLVGTLSHAATVVPHGRTFLRRMMETMKIPTRPQHYVRLNGKFRSDLQWWACFLPQWNGRSILPLPHPAHWFCSDASGTWGCGAVNDTSQWFQVKWPPNHHIAAKEMAPVVIALAIGGGQWKSSTVLARSDNMAVVCALSSGTAQNPLLMHLLRVFSAHFQISIVVRHVAGVENTAADALSRNNPDIFLSCTPQAASKASQVPSPLLDMLLHNQPDWTSASLFLGSLEML